MSICSFAMGVRQWVGGHAADLAGGLRFGLLIFLTIFGLRRMLRNDILAALAAAVLFTLMQGDVSYSAGTDHHDGALHRGIRRRWPSSCCATVWWRRSPRCSSPTAEIPSCWVTDWNTWYAPAGLASLLLLIGIAVFAFWRSLGGRDLLGR